MKRTFIVCMFLTALSVALWALIGAMVGDRDPILAALAGNSQPVQSAAALRQEVVILTAERDSNLVQLAQVTKERDSNLVAAVVALNRSQKELTGLVFAMDKAVIRHEEELHGVIGLIGSIQKMEADRLGVTLPYPEPETKP